MSGNTICLRSDQDWQQAFRSYICATQALNRLRLLALSTPSLRPLLSIIRTQSLMWLVRANPRIFHLRRLGPLLQRLHQSPGKLSSSEREMFFAMILSLDDTSNQVWRIFEGLSMMSTPRSWRDVMRLSRTSTSSSVSTQPHIQMKWDGILTDYWK